MSELSPQVENRGPLFLIKAMILTAMAAGMGWGIRGQYGHETGAMIAGTLASLTLVLLFVPKVSSLKAARCAAMMTVAIGIGGSMTYGQTVGLTHNSEVIGNWASLRWGLLGLFLKGGLWIGFGGVFLGMGLSNKQYRPAQILILMLSLFAIFFLGVWLYNTPFEPGEKILPRLYFSTGWEFYADSPKIKPRPEIWGGYLMSMVCLLAYLRLVCKDILAFRMGLIAIIGGGLGFSTGQCIQAYHAWNPEVFTTGALSAYAETFRFFNWWNMMETTFGLIWGATMALGLWFNQKYIQIEEKTEEVSIPYPVEIIFFTLHIILLINSELVFLPGVNGLVVTVYIQFGMLMAIIPLVMIAGGRIWPYFMLLIVVAIPIIGKTIRQMCYNTDAIPVSLGWFEFAQVPLGILFAVAAILTLKSIENQSARAFASTALFFTTLLYFGLNSAFFDYAWPWDKWTGRTPNQLIFMICAFCLILTAIIERIRALSEK